jgi:UDP-N-acetylglucosamine diphosphorylase / glucose-1-phosphate thymidylyltransferase / UDP-N-acetylgalactosamine diphosphorylase / glucosamine-1-phosphate N-acetyltransferase / galactosamine-1-phosphate N-acetyltransferase
MPIPQNLILFEDEAALTLEPLTLTRPVWDLRCGLRRLGEKILAHFPDTQVKYQVRPYLECLYPDAGVPPLIKGGQGGSSSGQGGSSSGQGESSSGRGGLDFLWINGAFLPGERFDEVLDLPDRTAWVQNGRVAAFRGLPPQGWTAGTQLSLEGFEKIEITLDFGRLYRYLWELVDAVGTEIEREARLLRPLGHIKGQVHSSAVVSKKQDVYIGPNCRIRPLAVIDAVTGPVVLDEGVYIGSNAVIEGPAYLGPNCQVKPQAHIRGCCFGEETRVGGEVSATIIQGFTNKQHGGFLGNAYLGSWCNLGSGTETSNLKNNYTPVKVQVGKDLVDSGSLFVGLMMGDHSKSAIGSVFNTGTVVGVACNLIEPGFPPRNIPSFHWGGAQKLTPYPFNKTLEIARAVVARRHSALTEAEIEILHWIYDNRLK